MTPGQYEADIAFLLARSGHAGSVGFSRERWTGMSSNSIVAIAYGVTTRQVMPGDRGDYAACVRTVRRLPKHRRTLAVMEALAEAKSAYLSHYPQDRSTVTRAA